MCLYLVSITEFSYFNILLYPFKWVTLNFSKIQIVNISHIFIMNSATAKLRYLYLDCDALETQREREITQVRWNLGSYPPGPDRSFPARTEVEERHTDSRAAKGEDRFHHGYQDERHPKDDCGALVERTHVEVDVSCLCSQNQLSMHNFFLQLT